MECFLYFIDFFKHNVQVEEIPSQDITAIINLTLRCHYAILLSDYPKDNPSHIQEGIAYDRDP